MNLRVELSGLAACCILTTGIAFGAPTQSSTTSKPKSPPPVKTRQRREIVINADTYAFVDDLFTADGSVEIIDGDMTLTADYVEVKLSRSKGNATKPSTKGNATKPSTKGSSYEFIKAIGKTNRVVLKTSQGKAVADRIEYDLTKGEGVAILFGKPEVTLVNGGRMSGSKSVVIDQTKKMLWTVGGKPKIVIPNEGRQGGLLSIPGSKKKPKKAAVKKGPGKVPVVIKATGKAVAKETQPKSTVPRAPTEVEAEKLIYDMKNNVIRCQGAVHVIDEELDLTADLLEVFRNDDGVTTKIVATGKANPVRLETVMEDFKRGIATGPKVLYDVTKESMILYGKADLKTDMGHFKNVERVNFKKTKTGFTFTVIRGETGTFTLWTDKALPNVKDFNKKKTTPKKETK